VKDFSNKEKQRGKKARSSWRKREEAASDICWQGHKKKGGSREPKEEKFKFIKASLVWVSPKKKKIPRRGEAMGI